MVVVLNLIHPYSGYYWVDMVVHLISMIIWFILLNIQYSHERIRLGYN